MKGGAYGARCSIEPIENNFTFSTYRDPSPRTSLETFLQVLKKSATKKIDEATLEKTIIGSYSKIRQPHTGMQKGYLDFTRFLSGISDEDRAARTTELLNTKSSDIAAAAASLYKRASQGKSVIISSREEAAKIAKREQLPIGDIGV
jgi:Zn-dependent M16 (insulinase) family peptidase